MRGYRKEWYLKNKEHVNKRAVEWRKQNPGKAKQIDKNWKLNNKEKIAERYKKYRLRNLANDAYRVNMRNKRIRRATPPWADKKKIKLIYKEARMVSDETGIKHHVDHIVPINSEYVCGLNVHYNMQVLDAKTNVRKGNYIWPDMPTKADMRNWLMKIAQAQKQIRLFA